MDLQQNTKIQNAIAHHLATGKYASAEEVVLIALLSLESQNDDWAAVSEALETLESGDLGLSLDEAVEEVRRRNNVNT